MSEFDLKQGRRYRAEISLGLLEQIADNEMISAGLRSRGFVDVHVAGDGAARHAEATWDAPDRTVSLPAQVVSVTEVEAVGSPPPLDSA